MIRNMHKHLSIIALACMVSLSATAKQRTQQQLLQAAQAFVQANGGPAKGAKSKVTFTQLLSNDQITLLNSSNGQALIMANDDAFQPIVGYTDAPVDRNNMAPAFEWWMTTISQAMEETLAKGATPTQVKRNAAYREAVDKLMTTEWGQSEPYYNLTPTYTQNYQETHYVTGCVATAMAQVMKYHDYPEKGKGYNRWTFYPNGNNSTGTTVRVNFANTYDWKNMLDKYTRGKYNDTEAKAVAVLMKDCGGSVSMQYAKDGSGAYAADACRALRNNFKYHKAIKLYTRAFYPKDAWMDLIYRELNDSCPILYGGATTQGFGHEFVFDGYDKNGLVHVNWGWEGVNDGYFDVALLNSREGSFTESQNMVIVRTPDDKRFKETYHSLWGSETGLILTQAGSRVNANNYVAYNLDVDYFTGYVDLVAANTKTGVVTQLTSNDPVSNVEYTSGFRLNISANLRQLANGEYRIYMATKSTSADKQELDWQPILSNETVNSNYLLTVNNGKYTLTKGSNNFTTGISTTLVENEASKVTRVYNLQGQEVYQSATDDFDPNRLPAHGTYIVRQGSKSVKIVR